MGITFEWIGRQWKGSFGTSFLKVLIQDKIVCAECEGVLSQDEWVTLPVCSFCRGTTHTKCLRYAHYRFVCKGCAEGD